MDYYNGPVSVDLESKIRSDYACISYENPHCGIYVPPAWELPWHITLDRMTYGRILIVDKLSWFIHMHDKQN